MELLVVKEFEAEAAERLPGFRVAFKDESLLQRILGVLARPFNKKFMTSYTTTLGKTVYFPTRSFYAEVPARTFAILAHEFVHATDGEERGFWFNLSYALPQALSVPLLALGFLGLFFCGWSWLLVAAGLACLVPWASPWRTKWELRGYTMNLAINVWSTGSTSEGRREDIAAQFYGPEYYFMTWGKEKARQSVEDCAAYAASPRILQDEPYAFVHSFMQKHGLLSRP